MSLRGKARMRRSCREIRPTLTLAFPIMAGMVSHMLIGLADTIMVGHVGVVPLAASALVNAVTHVPLVFAIGMVSAISILTAPAFGAGRGRDGGEVLRHGLVIAGGTGLVAAMLLVWLRPHLNRFGQPPEVVAAAGTYLLLFGCSVAPAIVAHACKQFSEALNHPWIPNFILLGAVGLNIFLNWILIYGNWGAPAMGLEGAGLATLLARTIMMLVMALFALMFMSAGKPISRFFVASPEVVLLATKMLFVAGLFQIDIIGILWPGNIGEVGWE